MGYQNEYGFVVNSPEELVVERDKRIAATGRCLMYSRHDGKTTFIDTQYVTVAAKAGTTEAMIEKLSSLVSVTERTTWHRSF